MMALRVLVVADDPLARAGLATLLARQAGCTVVGQLAGDAQVVSELQPYRPDVVVWDLGWEPARQPNAGRPPAAPLAPEVMTFLDQLTEVREAGYPVVALLPDETYAAQVWAAGVRGLLWRDLPAETLGAALPAVVQGLIVLAPALAGAVLTPSLPPPATPQEVLTPRELEVLHLLAEGLPNKTIADRLQISEHTVKFHVNALLGKLGAQSRTEAVVRATRLGVIVL